MRAAGLLLVFCCLGLNPLRAADADSYVLTPKPGPAPKINGPVVYGAHPGRPFLYRIPCTGRRPIRFSAKGLPASLRLDAATGIISGRAPEKRGEYVLTLHARNPQGAATRRFKIAGWHR
ncbi:MAG: putative Ig domain-containing protein [Acidobacteria bacterium]|nr:putative Ig domain-containing protein [Acidobacteriota bacterium]